ncbi:uncharacterized protein LOC141680007 [Apium graveolens]|uniref:uncharacterized protein LOC141680007 n=1 Tax=Apium graveolens TaxID=4045 RepID=UPI003D7A4AB5
MKIEKDKDFKLPKPLRGDSEKRDKSRYCRIHKDVDHDTDDCRQLKNEIEYLIRRGKFGRFSKGEEAGGQKRDNDRRDDDRRGEVMSIVGEPSKRSKLEMALEFGDPYLEGLKFPQDDPLVVKAASAYNAIMGRTGIHTFKVVPSTYNMVLKFSTRNGVGEPRGDQKMARSCYVVALRHDGTGGRFSP